MTGIGKELEVLSITYLWKSSAVRWQWLWMPVIGLFPGDNIPGVEWDIQKPKDEAMSTPTFIAKQKEEKGID